MADPELLKLLKSGPKAWNDWRSKQLTSLADLADADLAGTNLSRANLSSANFADADLTGAKLNFARLTGEMVTGKKAFSGKSQASLMASILHHNPQPMSTMQALTPPALQRALRSIECAELHVTSKHAAMD